MAPAAETRREDAARRRAAARWLGGGLLLVAVALSGCGEATTAPDAALERAERQWQAGPGSAPAYVMRQLRLCFCPAVDTMRVTVQAGRITALVNERTGQAAPAEQFAWYRTVPELFADIRRIPANGGRIRTVTYHPEVGYPVVLAVDPLPMAADDEVEWRTLSVTRLP